MDPNVAVDAPLHNRPGVPREKRPPEPVAQAPAPATGAARRAELLVEPTRRALPPVFSTKNPPRGLSGALRRLAYRLPDYRARRWMLLLLADRVDAQEHRLGRLVKSPLAWGVVGMGLLATLRLGTR